MKKRKRQSNVSRLVVFMLSVVILTGFCPEGVNIADIPITISKVKAADNIGNPRIDKNSSMESGQKVTWDCIYFGSYPQGEVTSKNGDIYKTLKAETGWDKNNDVTINGIKYRRVKGDDVAYKGDSDEYYNWNNNYTMYHYFKYEPIKWRVLNKDGEDAFLMADIALDNQQYNTNWEAVTWENSSIRSWLNGYEASVNEPNTDYTKKNFIDSAFSSKQKNDIITTKVINDKNIQYGTKGGKDTHDKIFLLSESEVYNTQEAKMYGFKEDYTISDEARRSHSSEYAHIMGDYISHKTTVWGLRSPGLNKYSSTAVATDGKIQPGGIVYTTNAVRPAIHLNLTLSHYSYAGTVSSDGAGKDSNVDKELISNKLKYSIKDTYSFENFGEKIPYEVFRKFLYPITALYYSNTDIGMGGVCYGMVASAMASTIYSSPEVKKYGRDRLYDVEKDDINTSTKISAKEYVQYAYVSQMTSEMQKIKKDAKEDLESLYKAVVNNVINNGQPISIQISGMYNGGGDVHSLGVLGIGNNNEDETELVVYDCNYPGEKCSLLLKKKDGKYDAWEYKFDEDTVWGTGEEGAKLIYYNPVDVFLKYFSKDTGYTPVMLQQTNLFIDVSNATSSILNSNNKSVILSPNVKDDDLLYIDMDNSIPNKATVKSNYSFWADFGNKVKFVAGNEQTKCSFISNESGIDMSIPKNTVADISVVSKNDNSVKLSSTQDIKGKYEVTYNTLDQKENIDQITISGEDMGYFNGKQTRNGIIINSDSLKNIKIGLSKVDENGKQKKIVSKDIPASSNKILISNNDEEEQFSVKEDSNGDGKFDKNIVFVSYGKKRLDKDNKSKIKVSSLRLSGISKKIAAGKKITLKVSVMPNNASNKKVVWKSSNIKVATVNQKGVVTLKKKTGGKKVTIIAIAQDGSKKTAFWKITSMKGAVNKVKITSNKSVKAGKRLKLKAKVISSKKANTKLLWKSSNTKYATVNAKGIVAAKKYGKGKVVKITVISTDGSNKKAVVKVKIK